MPVRLVHHEQILVRVATAESWLWCEPTKASNPDLKMESEKNKTQKHFDLSSEFYNNVYIAWCSRKKVIVQWMIYLCVQRLFWNITVCIYITIFCEERLLPMNITTFWQTRQNITPKFGHQPTTSFWKLLHVNQRMISLATHGISDISG